MTPNSHSLAPGGETKKNANVLWSEISQRLRAGMTAHEYDTWFKPLGFRLEENRAVLVVPNLFFSEWIRERHQDSLAQALTEALGRGISVAFELASGELSLPNPDSAEMEPLDLEPAEPEPVSPLAPRYTFDNFVVGPCNELAHAACKAVSDHPGRQYNPLFIFGAAGLGKTHLLTAVGNHVLKRFSGHKVVYCSTEVFTNELLQAVRFDGINAFRDKYRQVDGLLLDDIQFLAGRERTQEEFFHTFNALYEAGKQIILTSDKMPRDIPGLEKRLQTRFEWGLMTDLQPPDEETKVAILQAKAAEHGVDLSRQVCFYLAQQPESNVRVLEGYLTRIIAVSNFQGVEVTLDLVRRVVGPMLAERQVSLDDVMGTVARHYGIKVADIKSSRKTREVTHPRQVAMFLSRKLTRASFPEIGKAFGNKDHSTVVKGVKKMDRVLQEDPEEAERVRSLERILREGGISAEHRGSNGGD